MVYVYLSGNEVSDSERSITTAALPFDFQAGLNEGKLPALVHIYLIRKGDGQKLKGSLIHQRYEFYFKTSPSEFVGFGVKGSARSW